MERFYGYVPDGEFKGKRLFFVYQGAAPTKMMIDDGEYSEPICWYVWFLLRGHGYQQKQAKTLKGKLK